MHSKATYKKNTTFNNEDASNDERSGSWSQANNSRSSVFERLYQDSKAKQAKRGLSKSKCEGLTADNTNSKKVLNDSLYHQRSTTESSNHQVKIYEKNRKLKQDTLKKNETIKAYNELLEEEKCTLQPEINPISRIIANKLKHVNSDTLSKSREKNLVKAIDYIRQR